MMSNEETDREMNAESGEGAAAELNGDMLDRRTEAMTAEMKAFLEDSEEEEVAGGPPREMFNGHGTHTASTEGVASSPEVRVSLTLAWI